MTILYFIDILGTLVFAISGALSGRDKKLDFFGISAVGFITASAFLVKDNHPTKKVELDRAAIWHTFKAMTELSRPYGEANWQSYSSSQLISWKTGTSFGFRDAWAIGLNGTVLVGVWVGNADGEGRSGLTGINAAAPILLETIRLSNHNRNWLVDLKPGMDKKAVCETSGFLANEWCPKITRDVPKNAEKSGVCTYHRRIKLDETESYFVNSSCFPLTQTEDRTLFVLPSSMGYYYRQEHPSYMGLPTLHPNCSSGITNPIDIVYPNRGSKVFIPNELNGEKGRVILKATHQDPEASLFWSIENTFYEKTKDDHKIEALLGKGVHRLKVMDDYGNERTRTFEVVSDSN